MSTAGVQNYHPAIYTALLGGVLLRMDGPDPEHPCDCIDKVGLMILPLQHPAGHGVAVTILMQG